MTTHDPAIPSTTESGAPRESDAHSLSVGPDGPLMLHDVALVQKLARFDRERVPERSPHAKGSGAFGEFVLTQDVSAYTKADFLQPGRRTRTLMRFSTVAGELGAGKTWAIVTLLFHLVDIGGQYLAIDRTDQGEYAAPTRTLPNSVVVDMGAGRP